MPQAQRVIPIRHHQQRRSARTTTAEEAQQIERRLVCPVDVFEDSDGRLSLQFAENGGKDGRAVGVCIEQGRQVALRLHGHIV